MVSVGLLRPDEAAELLARQLTYPELGATRGPQPPGYNHLSEAIVLPAGVEFDEAADLLMTWQVQARAGLDVRASSLTACQDAVVLMRVGYGPLGVSIPCRVVYVVDDASRRGFAYGTLPGHPESGEESFVLTYGDDGRTTFTITAFSRPATVLARLGGPITGAAQRAMTGRYLRALRPT